jgi:hypothetical protein
LGELWGLQPGQLHDVVDTVNLYAEWPGAARAGAPGDATPPRSALRSAAEELSVEGREVVVLCGREVAEAFGLAQLWPLGAATRGGCCFIVMPHPSSVNRFWNDTARRRDAARMLREAAPLARSLFASERSV